MLLNKFDVLPECCGQRFSALWLLIPVIRSIEIKSRPRISRKLFLSAFALEIEIPNPPPEQIDSEWTLIPDEDNNLHLINVISALNEPQPRFNVEIGVIFELYTRDNPDDPQILRPNDLAALASSYFDPSRPTRIVSRKDYSHTRLLLVSCFIYLFFFSNYS